MLSLIKVFPRKDPSGAAWVLYTSVSHPSPKDRYCAPIGPTSFGHQVYFLLPPRSVPKEIGGKIHQVISRHRG